MVDRHVFYRGQTRSYPLAALALANTASQVVEPLLPRESLAGWPNAAFLESLSLARQRLRDDPTVSAAVAELLQAHHGLEQTVVDPPRLRVILPRGHQLEAAKPAYYAHRDTWYGNPRSQLNWWLPLHDVEQQQTFVIYPEAFNQPVANDSHEFDYGHWRQQVGFANSAAPKGAIYPRALGKLTHLQTQGFAARKGDLLVFSAAHLHQTLAFDHGLPRFSIDFRTVYLPDHEAGLGAPDPDNASRGTTLPEYRRLS
ncbi:MAG: hypothetical protein AB7S38_41060 [Vulcanimicrobiota bacterium]